MRRVPSTTPAGKPVHSRQWFRLALAGTMAFAVVIRVDPPPHAQATGSMQAVESSLLDQLSSDADADAILDEREAALGTNPFSADTDGDGFEDFFEDSYRDFGFDPIAPTFDADGDGLASAFEASVGTSPASIDTDGDGYGDFDEVLNAFSGYDPLATTDDDDFDGLADVLEAQIGTSPSNVDTDGDGIDDFAEFHASRDPTVADPSGSAGELVGTTYSAEMAAALQTIRGGGTFPSSLAEQLPYPQVTQPPVASSVLRPSSALMQQAVFNPANSPGLYDTNNEIVDKLKQIAEQFDGNPGPRIVRLFRWTGPTEEKRHLYALKISDNPQNNENEPEILFMGMHHARELITTSITMGLIKDLTDKYAAGDAATRKIVDNHEIWVLPVVNPDGYTRALGEFGAGAQGPRVGWRKNVRKVAELTPEGRAQTKLGVDLNRNYGFEHIRSLTAAQRAALTEKAKESNGLRTDAAGSFDPDNETYAGHTPFSDVETRAVKGLAEDVFETTSEVSGFRCSLSWHSSGGEVAHPMGHATANGLTPADRRRFKDISDAFANVTGYENLLDTFPVKHYDTFGDSDDWLYKARKVFALTVESFSRAERGRGDPGFFPITAARRDAVTTNNIKGGRAVIKACGEDFGDAPRSYRTTRDDDGPRYADGSNQRLGLLFDTEEDGLPTTFADGDDADALDDEDGIVMADKFIDATWNVSQPGASTYRLRGWWDLDRDGFFDHPSELIVDDVRTLSPAVHTFRYALPFNPKRYYSRFRLTWLDGSGVTTSTDIRPWGEYLSSDGFSHGEVEDYPPTKADRLIVIGPTPNQVPVGNTATVTATVLETLVGLPGAEVVFTRLSGNFMFTAGNVSPDGQRARLTTDALGKATMTVVPLSAGPALLQVSVTHNPLSAFVVFRGR